jgi:AcrR family transcriptional regulator
VVQHYFRRKQDLIVAAAGRLAGRNERMLERCRQASPDDALQVLRLYCAAILGTPTSAAPSPWNVWLCLWAGATSDPELARAVQHHRRSWRAQLTELVRDGQRDGSIDVDLDAELEARALAGRAIAEGLNTIFDGPIADRELAVDEVLGRLCAHTRRPVDSYMPT